MSPSNLIPRLEGHYISNGRIMLKKIIGRGGWGVVYLGVEIETRDLYAVKCIRNPNPLDDSLPDEINFHDACSDATEGVLQIHNVIVDDDLGLIFIITDYCEDRDLLNSIVRYRFMGKDHYIRSIFVQILDAVEACHKIGVYHRDLKPQNILMKEKCKKIALADFGLATSDKRSTEFHLGTSQFMAPEVHGGYPYSFTSYSPRLADIWSLGVILMNLVCDSLPWGQASAGDRGFVCYANRDPDYLLHYFSISIATNNLLKRIFTMKPRERISIKEMRNAVLEIETFGAVIQNDVDLEVEGGRGDITRIYDGFIGKWDIEIPLPKVRRKGKKHRRGKLEVQNRPIDISDEDMYLHILLWDSVSRSYRREASSDSPAVEAILVDKEETAPRPSAPERKRRRRRRRVPTPAPPTFKGLRSVLGDNGSSDSELNASPESNEIDGGSDADISSGGNSSGGDSEGPITPEQYAADDTAAIASPANGIDAENLEEVPNLSDDGIGMGGSPLLVTNSMANAAKIEALKELEKGKQKEIVECAPLLPPRNAREQKPKVPLPCFVKSPMYVRPRPRETAKLCANPIRVNPIRANPIGAQVLTPPAYIPHYKTSGYIPSPRGLDAEQLKEHYRRYVLHLEPNLAISMEPRLDVTVPGAPVQAPVAPSPNGLLRRPNFINGL